MPPKSYGGRGNFGRFRGRGNYNKSFGQGSRGKASRTGDGQRIEDSRLNEGTEALERWNDAVQRREIDEMMGFAAFENGPAQVGWLINIQPTLVKETSTSGGSAEESSETSAAVDLYFLKDDGGMFRSSMVYYPYFLIASRSGKEQEVEEWLRKKYEDRALRVERIYKDDLKLPNHLSGNSRQFIKISFRNVENLLRVRKDLLVLATKASSKMDALDSYAEVIHAERKNNSFDIFDDGSYADFEGFDESGDRVSERGNFKNSGFTRSKPAMTAQVDPSEWIIDIREYDIPYYLRVSIDKDLRVGLWYNVSHNHNQLICTRIPERVERAEPVVMAYDIETTKAPLKFPDSATDQIMMISYMIDGQGFLITNREIVSSDIEDFDYTPKPEYEGPFTIFNEENEAAVIRRWFDHIRDAKPSVMATYNGDSFDFPFVYARATVHGLDMFKEIGFHPDSEGEFKSRTCLHMDCFKWVKRDSYLPQGSQGLKAVTVAKLGYNPIELDPELMTPYAAEQPQILAQYSVSDAVATYYLYMKYVHPFIFSLCNIIPLNPDEVLRKGSGTLCETLLMVEAYNKNIIMPNKHVNPHGNMYEGHLLESETYVGGHVEALEAGVFRSDIPSDFKLVPSRCQQLLDELDSALKFSIVQEEKLKLEDVVNYDEVKLAIQSALETMRDNPTRQDCPIIYHLDVAAMYPNIMLSNRLQPDSVVDEAMCAACDYNVPGKICDRRMTWAWRGEYFPAKLDEYKMVRNALESENFPPKAPSQPNRKFSELAPTEQTSLLHKRLGDYSRKVYKKTHETKVVEKEAIICQRENPFYINTVRDFRDRRYTYKGLHKTWKKTADQAQQEGRSIAEVSEAKKMIVIYDSLQLAHKCILNSFYGYVMRKGARWHSMEMAGITCLTGAKIIQMAREIIEEIGRPLELDTDGIWCMLPGIFPENFTFKLRNGKSFGISYPCSMLNHLVHQKFTNHQYHELNPENRQYEVRSENSIFFELDGPYRAMILPASKEEDKLLKKRYAVFNPDGSLAELKGFEVKRRGELQLIKIFQTAIFEKFLLGKTLKDCYAAVAEVANLWLDVLVTKAVNMHDEELFNLISENRSMSKTLTEYGAQKSTSIRTAKRLSEFLGKEMVKDKGLSCRFIISAKPHGSPVTERAVPVAIFSAEPSIQQKFLRKWLKDNSLVDFSIRSILDWNYYIERLGSVIQKLITIPAAMQKISNPVPRIHHPDWLARRLTTREDTFKQHKINDMFQRQKPIPPERLEAIRLAKVKALEKESKSLEPTSDETPTPIPDIRINYSGWIAAMKPIWRAQRLARRSLVPGMVSGSITSMFHRQNIRFQPLQVEIVQLSAHPHRPGEFNAWVFVNDVLQRTKITIPREFYVNVKKAPVENFFPRSCQAVSVAKTLPRSQARLQLFKVSVMEKDFVEEASNYQKLFTSPDVEGVYELQVPPLQRLLMGLGSTFCVSSESKVSLSLGLEHGFNFSDLSKVERSIDPRKYLGYGRSIHFILVYHFFSGSRHAIGIFTPGSNCKVVLTDRSNSIRVSEVQKYYQTVFDSRRDLMRSELGAFDYDSEMMIELSSVASDKELFKHLDRELNMLKGQKSTAGSVLMIHSQNDQSFYEERVSSTSKFPILMVHSSKADNKFEAFGWQRFSAERMIQHFLRASPFLRERVIQAELFDVPIANFERDAATFLMDLELSKRLIHSDHVLWWSSSSKPDLGGKENDANLEHVLDASSTPEISTIGAYLDASVELSVGDLAINSVIQSSWVYEMENGDTGSLGFQNASHNLDEYSKGSVSTATQLGDSDLSVQTFTIFRSMVKSWVAQSGRSEGHHYRGLIRHFWRWMSSASSSMFDPALHRFVQGLMRKVFSKMLFELRRLGTGIIYADFNRIFLSTNKASARKAFAYASYIVTAVNGREVFKFLHLEIVRFWEQLLWADVSNFAGIICEDFEARPEDQDVENVDMHWNMVNFLPEAIQQDFLGFVCTFVHDIQQCKREAGRAYVEADSKAEAERKKSETQMLQLLITHKLTRRLLKIVNQICDRQLEAAADPELRKTFDFPRLPGSHLTMKKPVLEFVKMVCFVTGLVKVVEADVRTMKRTLLDLIGVREFSNEAIFRNPCMPFKIPVTICKHCNAMRSFDLCRDPDVLASAVSRRSEDRTSEWPCSHCGHSFERLTIEAIVIEQLQRLVAGYQLQDLRCSKCSQLKEDALSVRCGCSNEYVLDGERGSAGGGLGQLRKRLLVARTVAESYGMDTLLEVAQQLISLI
ncbi:DNA polymerase epsilon subunit 1, partial [Phakopsora pachyrhizi]